MREKFSESNALAALSRALKAQRDEPAAPSREPPADHKPEKRKRREDRTADKQQASPVEPREQLKAAGGGERTPKKSKKDKKEKKEKKGKDRKRDEEQTGRGSRGHDGAGPSSSSALEDQAAPDALRLCIELVSLASSLETSNGGAVLQASEQRASELAAALVGLVSVSGASRELQALRQGLQGLRECLQGSTTLPESYRCLQRSAATLQLATAAAQLAHSAAQHSAAAQLPEGPSHGGCSRAVGSGGGGSRAGGERGGPGSGGRDSEPDAAATSFQRWYLSSFADSFSAELEALQESEAAPPAAVLRGCIAAQAGLFSPAYQRLALLGTHGS